MLKIFFLGLASFLSTAAYSQHLGLESPRFFQALDHRLEVLHASETGHLEWQLLSLLDSIESPPLGQVYQPSDSGIYALDAQGRVWLRARLHPSTAAVQRERRLLSRQFPAAQRALLWASPDTLWAYHPKGQRLYGLSLKTQEPAFVSIDSTVEKLDGDVLYLAQRREFLGFDNFLRAVSIFPQIAKTQVRKLLRGLPSYHTHLQFWQHDAKHFWVLFMPAGVWYDFDLDVYHPQRLFSMPEESLRRPAKQRAHALQIPQTQTAFPAPFLQFWLEAQNDSFSYLVHALIDRQMRWDEVQLEALAPNSEVWEVLERRKIEGPYDLYANFRYWHRHNDAFKYRYRLRLRDVRGIEILSHDLGTTHGPLGKRLATFPDNRNLYLPLPGGTQTLCLYNLWGKKIGCETFYNPKSAHWLPLYLPQHLNSGFYTLQNQDGWTWPFFLAPSLEVKP